jgi:hypothetical protein
MPVRLRAASRGTLKELLLKKRGEEVRERKRHPGEGVWEITHGSDDQGSNGYHTGHAVR